MAGDSPPDGVDPGKLESYLSDQEFEVGLHYFVAEYPHITNSTSHLHTVTLHHAATPHYIILLTPSNTTPSNTIPATLRRAAYTSPSTLHHAATPSHHTI